MIVIDVSLNVFKSINIDSTKYFFIDKGEIFEFYTILNGMLFRYIRKKTNDMNDSLFLENNFKNSAIQINKISNVNETEWREAFDRMKITLDAISYKLDKVIDDDNG